MISLRQCINAKCKSCIYDPLSGLGHWRQQVELCTITSCPLYAVRPRTKAEPRASAVRAGLVANHAREPIQ